MQFSVQHSSVLCDPPLLSTLIFMLQLSTHYQYDNSIVHKFATKKGDPHLFFHSQILLRHKRGSGKCMYFHPASNNKIKTRGWWYPMLTPCQVSLLLPTDTSDTYYHCVIQGMYRCCVRLLSAVVHAILQYAWHARGVA